MNEEQLLRSIEAYRAAAHKLRQLSGGLPVIRSGFTGALSALADTWQGPAADAYFEANDWLLKDLEALRLEMESLARDIEAEIAAFNQG